MLWPTPSKHFDESLSLKFTHAKVYAVNRFLDGFLSICNMAEKARVIGCWRESESKYDEEWGNTDLEERGFVVFHEFDDEHLQNKMFSIALSLEQLEQCSFADNLVHAKKAKLPRVIFLHKFIIAKKFATFLSS